MKAITIVPGTRTLQMAQRPEPSITAPDQVKMRVRRVGICGTDREEASGGRAKGPETSKDLVLGHEMLGQVIEVGSAVSRVKPGDFSVFTVRRGCGKCMPCRMNRSDMCRTGDFRERGIWGLDGYQTEIVVDQEQYAVKVPDHIEPAAVLVEPLSVAEKAIDEAVRLQYARLPAAQATPNWLFGRRCLVAGLGPIGLLAAMILRLRGAEVFGLDVVDPDSVRPQWLIRIGGHYVDGRQTTPDHIDRPMDLIFEAAGIARLAFNLLDALAPSGVIVLTGIPGGDRPVQIAGAELIRRLVLDNQAMIGSVNAARDHYQLAVDDLAHASLQWGEHIAHLITHRHPSADFQAALGHHADDEIKSVIEWV
jgi:threonine dehydrogenase-like Zn-dependent dehydrogenase